MTEMYQVRMSERGLECWADDGVRLRRIGAVSVSPDGTMTVAVREVAVQESIDCVASLCGTKEAPAVVCDVPDVVVNQNIHGSASPADIARAMRAIMSPSAQKDPRGTIRGTPIAATVYSDWSAVKEPSGDWCCYGPAHARISFGRAGRERAEAVAALLNCNFPEAERIAREMRAVT